ncbi:hypothetical protein BDR06DRAFT_1011993 [Suillus hirtellus]|nr:hypothetical protein BDR06DRAFT_1011993 [Suillus hirtellus]
MSTAIWVSQTSADTAINPTQQVYVLRFPTIWPPASPEYQSRLFPKAPGCRLGHILETPRIGRTSPITRHQHFTLIQGLHGMSNTDFTTGSLYIAGLVQARASYVWFIIPTCHAQAASFTSALIDVLPV